MTTVRDVLGWLEDAYPPGLAEDWDRVGLDIGSLDAAVRTVGFAVDATDAVIAEARAHGAHLLITHHPLLLRGIHAVRADQPKGRQVMALLASGISHIAAHTNADHGSNGVSDALAHALALTDLRPLAPLPGDHAQGTGRVGVLPTPRAARQVAAQLADAVPATAGGIKLGGDPDRTIRTVAIVGGAGDSFLDAARQARVDCYITGDLRHHPAQDLLAHDDAPVLIDVPHFAAEWLWLPVAERLIKAQADADGVRLQTYVSTINTDPWTLRLP